jgi:hypothetical protein
VALEAIIATCLAKHPDDRYRDASAVAKALGDLPELPPWTDAEAAAWWSTARLTPRRPKRKTSSKMLTVPQR